MNLSLSLWISKSTQKTRGVRTVSLSICIYICVRLISGEIREATNGKKSPKLKLGRYHTHTKNKRNMSNAADGGGGHNPFLVDDDDDDFSENGRDTNDRERLLQSAARENVAVGVTELSYSTTGGDADANENGAAFTSSAAVASSSSVFAKGGQREKVPPLPAAPRVVVSNAASTASSSRGGSGGGGGFWIFSFKYYQKYFDVDTADVVRRIKKGTYGALGGQLFLDDVKEKPDLYGAFWGCATLVFVVAMGGNFADYLESMSSSSGSSSGRKRMLMRKLLEEGEPPAMPYAPPPPSPDSVSVKEPWKFDVTKVTQCAAMTYAYVFLFPLSLYLVKRCYAGVRSASYTALVCLYGYSIMSYIPASILCIFPVETLRWVAVMAACAVSSASLFRNVDALLKGESGNTKAMAIAKGMGVAIVGANVVFAICLKELFFRF